MQSVQDLWNTQFMDVSINSIPQGSGNPEEEEAESVKARVDGRPLNQQNHDTYKLTKTEVACINLKQIGS